MRPKRPTAGKEKPPLLGMFHGHNVFLVGTMGDTQKSPTISAQNQGIASQVACDSRNCSKERVNDDPPVLVGESSLVRIEMLAKADPSMVFTSVAHRIDLSLLGRSFRKLRKNESTGVDKVTAKQYAENLDQNLYKLRTLDLGKEFIYCITA